METACRTCGAHFKRTHGNQRHCPQHRQVPATVKPCAGCGTRIQSRGNQIYCLPCQDRLDVRPKGTCAQCGQAFSLRSFQQRFCSQRCKSLSRNAQSRDCRTCGQPFKPVANQQYCGGCKPPKYERVKLKRLYDQHKKESCERCGFEAEHSCQLDVHHRDGDFRHNEAANLETLCANCHRLESRGERQATSPPPPEVVASLKPTQADLDSLTLRLKGQGMTTPVATREARRRLGL